MTNPQHHPNNSPSNKQIGYLKDLAFKRGQSFAYPETSAEASREIKRLLSLGPGDGSERRREVRAVQHAMATRLGDAASVRNSELSGYGSAASWVRRSAR